jgi:hypothetical protein
MYVYILLHMLPESHMISQRRAQAINSGNCCELLLSCETESYYKNVSENTVRIRSYIYFTRNSDENFVKVVKTENEINVAFVFRNYFMLQFPLYFRCIVT